MKIALLCPSKKRMERKNRLIGSIIQTVKNPDNITLFLGIDSEGDETLPICKQLSKSIPFIKVIELPKETRGKIHNCWNFLARLAYHTGDVLSPAYDVLALIADDMVFETYGWDEEIIKEFSEKLPADKWKLVTCNDGHKNGELPINYFVHRRYYEIIGYVACERFIINWCDNWVKLHFTPFNRYCYRPDIVIRHNHWIYAGQPDEVGKEMMAREGGTKDLSDDLWAPLESVRYEEVLKIAQTLNLNPIFRPGEFSKHYWNTNT